jgi:hypothetical protein
MTYNTGVRPQSLARSRFDPTAEGADKLDRILFAVCAVIWLAVLGAAVAATVALVDLGRGHTESSTSSGTPWLLYGVIVVSALIIIGAIPLLIRARRAALEEPQPTPGGARPATGRAPTATRAPEPPTQKLRAPAAAAGAARPRGAYTGPLRISTFDAGLPPAVERVWLRCAVVIACDMGLALLAIGIATYLMAAGHDTASWAAYVVAGLFTVAMPVIPFFYLRQLHGLLDTSGS